MLYSKNVGLFLLKSGTEKNKKRNKPEKNNVVCCVTPVVVTLLIKIHCKYYKYVHIQSYSPL